MREQNSKCNSCYPNKYQQPRAAKRDHQYGTSSPSEQSLNGSPSQPPWLRLTLLINLRLGWLHPCHRLPTHSICVLPLQGICRLSIRTGSRTKTCNWKMKYTITTKLYIFWHDDSYHNTVKPNLFDYNVVCSYWHLVIILYVIKTSNKLY